MKKLCKILFVGGGSVGHIAPAVAVWQAVKEKQPEAQAHFVCARREDDQQFLSQAPLQHTAITVARFGLRFPWTFLQAFTQGQRVLASFKPDVIFSKGGYVSVPICLAAKLRGIPIVLHESDVIGGRANRLVGRWADAICTGFPKSQFLIPKSQYTGNPIRPQITQGNREEGLKLTGLSGDRPILLVIGGSQGAQALNEAITTHFGELTEICDIIHITGRGKETRDQRPETSYFSVDFAHDTLPHLYACADLALSRAGAGSIGELAANGIPAILVPLRGVPHAHQHKNAEVAAASGGCLVLEQEQLDDQLVASLTQLVTSNEKRATMREAIKTLHKPHAAEEIATVILAAIAQT